jgi:hypothetical protein
MMCSPNKEQEEPADKVQGLMPLVQDGQEERSPANRGAKNVF